MEKEKLIPDWVRLIVTLIILVPNILLSGWILHCFWDWFNYHEIMGKWMDISISNNIDSS